MWLYTTPYTGPKDGGRPIRIKLAERQAHDGRSAADMFETVEVGHILLADRAYDGDALRAATAERGAWANIRAMPNRVKTFPSSLWVCRQRNAVERFFNKLKRFEAVATRYDKRDDNLLASIQLAAIRIWLQSYESVTWSASGSIRVVSSTACLRRARRRHRTKRQRESPAVHG